jgi:voltage-gated potassium channel Kch
MDSFVPRLYDNALHLLAWLTPHRWLTHFFPRFLDPGWVEVWLLLNLGTSGLALVVVTSGALPALATALLVYGAVRVLELCVYLAKVVLGDPFQRAHRPHRYGVTGYRRTLVLAIHNYGEVIFWFATAYAYYHAWFQQPEGTLATVRGALYYSIVTMTTVGYGDIRPSTPAGRSLVAVHLAVAMFMAVVILGRFVANLPAPETMDNRGDHTKKQ